MFHHVAPSPTQRECIGSLRHKISFIRCKPPKKQGLSMHEKYTRLPKFASPTGARCNFGWQVTGCTQTWRSCRGVPQFPHSQVARPSTRKHPANVTFLLQHLPLLTATGPMTRQSDNVPFEQSRNVLLTAPK